jgi:flagellar hook-length control protein FliK
MPFLLFGEIMSNTHLGANMGALLPAHSPSVDRKLLSEAPVEKANGNTSDFKSSMSSIETPQEKRVKERSNASPVKEDKSTQTSDTASTDNVSEAEADRSEGINKIESEQVVTEADNHATAEAQEALVLPTSNLLSPIEASSALESINSLSQQSTALINELDDLMPVIPELSHAVQQIIAQSTNAQTSVAQTSLAQLSTAQLSLAQQGAVNTANTVVSASPVLMSGILPTAQLVNKLSITADLPEGNAFDISEALSKELEKPSSSPLLAITPLAAKVSADVLLPSQLSLNTSFQSAGQWGEAVTEKVMWMSSKGIKEAIIQLDPPELGSLQVKVGVNQDQAQVSFTVQNASVREALDQQSMRLREMFAEDGLNLTDVDVSDQSSKEEPNEEKRHNSLTQNGNDESDEVMVTPLQSASHSYSLVDAYI